MLKFKRNPLVKKIFSDLSILPNQSLVTSMMSRVTAGLLSHPKRVLRRKQLSHKNFSLHAMVSLLNDAS